MLKDKKLILKTQKPEAEVLDLLQEHIKKQRSIFAWLMPFLAMNNLYGTLSDKEFILTVHSSAHLFKNPQLRGYVARDGEGTQVYLVGVMKYKYLLIVPAAGLLLVVIFAIATANLSATLLFLLFMVVFWSVINFCIAQAMVVNKIERLRRLLEAQKVKY